MPKMSKQIKRIMKHFDFEKVHKCMVALNWEWGFRGSGVPSIERLREHAENMLHDMEDVDDRCCRCGGFRVTIRQGLLELLFEVDSWRGDNE